MLAYIFIFIFLVSLGVVNKVLDLKHLRQDNKEDEDGRSLLQDFFEMKKAKRELMGLKIQASREKGTKLYERKLALRESLFATRKANRSARRCITRLSREIEREIEMLEYEYEYEQSISRRI